MRYNVRVTPLTEHAAYARLREAAQSADQTLTVDRGAVRWQEAPFPGVAFGLVLGEVHALLFVPAADIAGPDWRDRLPARLEAARRYLLGFPRPAR